MVHFLNMKHSVKQTEHTLARMQTGATCCRVLCDLCPVTVSSKHRSVVVLIQYGYDQEVGILVVCDRRRKKRRNAGIMKEIRQL